MPLTLQHKKEDPIPRARREVIEIYSEKDKLKTWMRDFDSYQHKDFPTVKIPNKFSRGEIVRYFESKDLDVELDLQRIGNFLSISGDLRNISTYEGLLAAHQQDSSEVTQDFIRGYEKLELTAREGLCKVVCLLSIFIDNYPKNKEIWLNFMSSDGWCIQRIKSSLCRKGIEYDTLEKVNKILMPFTVNQLSSLNSQDVVSSIERSIFSGKKQLMKDFHEKVKDLGSLLSSEV